VIAVPEDEVGNFGGRATAGAFFAALGDAVLAGDAATFKHSPTGGAEGGFDMLGTGLSFVHSSGMVTLR